MTVVPFNYRELTRAWRELKICAKPTVGERKNAQRLLLFYAVECGLKAALLKRANRDIFENEDINRLGHDLRKILRELRVSSQLSLPEGINLRTIRKDGLEHPRNGDISILHQAWRYGGECLRPTDEACESNLESIMAWIEGELK